MVYREIQNVEITYKLKVLMAILYCVLTLFTIFLINFVHGNKSRFITEYVEVTGKPYEFTVDNIAEAQIDLLTPKGFRFLLFSK